MSREAFALPKFVGTNISFEREPRNAIEYLMSVRKEAESIPDIMTIDKKVIEYKCTYNYKIKRTLSLRQ